MSARLVPAARGGEAGGAERRCLVLHPGALGDVLLALPALAHLRALGLSPVVAVAGRLVGLLAGAGDLAARDLEDLRLHRLFAARVDPEVLDELGGHAAVVSWFGAGDPAYRRHLARLPCPVVVARARPPAGGPHAAHHLVTTLAALGPLPGTLPAAALRPPAAEREAAERWLATRGLAPGEAVVLQAGAGAPGKAWPGFPGLLGRLRDGGVPVVALAGPADGAAVDRLLEAGLEAARVARDLALPRLAALLGAARACVGNDSGPTHLAAAVGCPTVALFGPTDPARWAPVGRWVEVVTGATAGAREGSAPWAGLDAGRVLAALDRATDRAGSRAVA